MRTGDLRRRVAIQSRSVTLDSWGQQIAAWDDVLTNCPAAIEALAGNERLVALQIHSEITHKVTIRYNAAFSIPADVGSWRITYASRIFNIHAAMNPDEKNRWIEIMCSEGLNDGR